MKYEELNTDGYKDIKVKYSIGNIAAKVLASKQMKEDIINDILHFHMNTKDFDLSFLDEIYNRICLAKENREKIMICGDYDCDGVCATSILYDALTRFGCDCGYYIPDRFLEGYGVNINTVKSVVEKGYKLLITVDNGVSATTALQYAKDHGLCVILSDHHAYEETNLVYDYFLHPNILPPFYNRLCGAGLSYLISKRLLGEDNYHTVLACIATIGDMVGVLDANRVIIKEGLSLLKTFDFPAISLLADTSNHWDTTKIAFQIVPKINALGRMADQANVNTFVKYLLIQDRDSLKRVVSQINNLNTLRKKISASNEKNALAMVDEQQSFIVVASEMFHEGLNGIVAAKIVNKYNRPVMVLSQDGDILKGSIRSVGIDLSTFFDDFKHQLLSYGGHRQAAGISLHVSKLDDLTSYAQAKCVALYEEECKTYIPLSKSEITLHEVESLASLEPFGTDFEKPKFGIVDSQFELKTMSNGLHLKFVTANMEYLYFQHGNQLKHFENRELQFIGELGINTFRNQKSISMIVDDVIE